LFHIGIYTTIFSDTTNNYAHIKHVKETLLSIYYEALIKLLRAERVERGVTQVDLAQKLGVAQETLSSWETLKNAMDIETVRLWAHALGIDFLELMARWLGEIEILDKRTRRKTTS
jgi:DNA-binding XRE family transcriptional regulator